MIRRFTAYRRQLSKLVEAGAATHTLAQRNADDEPQYEGVIFSDGTCTLRWRTAAKSTSTFASFSDMISVHGHPEYGTELVFHDGDAPAEWLAVLEAHALDVVGGRA